MQKLFLRCVGVKVALLAIFALSAGASELQDIMKARNLSEKDVLAAVKTYQPSGRKDEFVVFSSGGQSGQVIVYGVPSMRIYKYIGVFTPEPWQGYGYDGRRAKRCLNKARFVGKISLGATRTTQISRRKTASMWGITFLSMTRQIHA